jgi:tetratricopeptide (TPR) repeat protein
LTNARDYYYAGNLEQAEDVLVRAQNRWSTTNSTEEPEVVYWLGLVRGALSLQSGRTIPVTAPLYAEMSQLLSDAKKNYDEGVRLLSGNQRQEGLVRFSEARQKTREVRLMFPMNQDARLLELRVDQQTDQEAFTTAFRQRLTEAVAGTKPNVRSVESFAELQDLVEINPRYPGIQQMLSQAEIDMGYRPPPPDPRDLARSTQLTQMAMTIINARNSAQYEVALAQLNEALQLNPNNNQAMTGKDQVQTWMTGTGVIVLDSYSQDEYTRAVQEFQRGNTLNALAIVQQLLQNPNNQRSTLILELQRRIESVL